MGKTTDRLIQKIWLSENLYQAVLLEQEKTGASKGSIVRKALAAYLLDPEEGGEPAPPE